jgi:hypothetical protein
LNIPKIKNVSLDCFISPSIFLESSFDSCVDDCVGLYLDPYSKFNVDRFYGLNNLLFFIASELNSGIVHQCSFSGYSYDSSDYNFFMIDLENEFYDCGHQIPTGYGSFLICQKVSSRQSCIAEPFPYKSKSGDGYTYVMPIANCFYYSDNFYNISYGNCCSEIILNKNLNFLNTGFKYIGGSCEECKVYQGEIFSGFECGFVDNSNLNIFQNTFNIFIDSNSVDQTQNGRCLCFCKNYVFSGVQPIKIISNYPLLEIKNPIYCTDLNPYSENNESGLNNFYYFVYDVGNFQNSALKFLSPDCTFFTDVKWNEKNSSKQVTYLDAFNSGAKIQNNAAYIRYDFSSLINSNPYYLCFCDNYFICFNVIGGIL